MTSLPEMETNLVHLQCRLTMTMLPERVIAAARTWSGSAAMHQTVLKALCWACRHITAHAVSKRHFYCIPWPCVQWTGECCASGRTCSHADPEQKAEHATCRHISVPPKYSKVDCVCRMQHTLDSVVYMVCGALALHKCRNSSRQA